VGNRPRSVRPVEREPQGPSSPARRPSPGDVAVAAVTWLAAASTAAFTGLEDGEPRFTWAAALVLAAGALPLCWRRSHPLPVWVVVSVTAAVYGAADWPDPILPFAPIVALVSVFERCSTRARVIVWVLSALIAVLVATVVGDADALDWWLAALVLAAAPLAGDYLRQRRLLVEQAEARSRRLEAERAQAVAAARAAERARVARELHDVVAHHVTMLVVQAEAAASQHDTSRTAPDSQQTQATFDELARSGRAAMTELRQLLGALRPGAGPAPIAPQPGLGDLDELFAGVTASRVTVTAAVDPAAMSVPTATGLAAYRVVQEGLTNVVKHAPGARAHVNVQVDDGALSVTVVDEPPPGRDSVPPARAGSPAGVGLVGLRERVELLGGSLDATQIDGGGFRLAARLPLDAR
jgi:signal transduction histidine kinase